MSDTTDSTEQMHLTPDADRRDQLVNDGGDATILIHQGSELEAVLDNAETLTDPENSANLVMKSLSQWMTDSISLVARKWIRIPDHKKKTMSNAIDSNIGHCDNEIDMTGMESSNDTKVDDIRPQVVRFVSPDDAEVNALSSSRFLTDNITTLVHMRSNANNGDYDNEIDMADLVCMKGTRVNNIDPRMGRLVFSDGSGVIVLSAGNATDISDLEILVRYMTVGNCMNQVRRSGLLDSFKTFGPPPGRLASGHFGDIMCSERQNQWQALTAHQSKREEVNNQRKDNQHQMRQKTKCNKRNGIVERKTLIPRDQLYLVNQGKVLNDKKTMEESSFEAGATIEMSLNGGMKKEELMETSETEEDIEKRKLAELSESKPPRFSEDGMPK